MSTSTDFSHVRSWYCFGSTFQPRTTTGGESHTENLRQVLHWISNNIKLIMKGFDCMMKKRVLMVILSMALVVGLVGIVNAATIGNNSIDTQSQAPNASAYVNHNNVSNRGTVQGTTSQTDQTLPAQTTQIQPIQTDQTSPSQTDINTPMKSSNVSMNNQVQNMSVNTQMPTMSMSTPMNGQLSATSQSGQRASGNTMMGSTGRMSR